MLQCPPPALIPLKTADSLSGGGGGLLLAVAIQPPRRARQTRGGNQLHCPERLVVS